MAVILTRILRYRTASEEFFLDLAEDWYVDAIQKLRAAGVMRGDENNHASPDAPVTREEAVVLIARAFDIAPLEGDLSYADANDVSDWAAGCVGAMTAAEYIRGGENNCFFPKNPLTRAEAVTIFNNMITACFYESGEYDYRPFEGLAKFVIIAADDVTILNFDIGGNILLAEGVNPETIRLKTVQHYGNIYQCVPGGFIRHLKASSYIVPINEHLPVCSWDSSLFVKDEQGRMRYADDTVTTYFGVDVSSWQGNVDWHKLKAQGVHFAFLRVGYRGYESGVINPDTKFEENIKGALDAGIHVGVYFFSRHWMGMKPTQKPCMCWTRSRITTSPSRWCLTGKRSAVPPPAPTTWTRKSCARQPTYSAIRWRMRDTFPWCTAIRTCPCSTTS
jgi:hypothetical protein